MTESCQTESVIPAWVSVGFAIGSLIMLSITIMYSMKSLKKAPSSSSPMTAISTETKPLQNKEPSGRKTDVNAEQSEWDKASGCFAKFKLCAKDVWRRKSVYVPLITHLSDTATDFASVVELGIIAANSNPNECGVNVWYLFSLAIVCMVLYRIVSGYKVYQITASCSRAFLQLLDFELYRVLYISHLYGLNATSSPQRLLSVLEAVFEAAPQSVIQIVFLMFSGNNSTVIIASAVFSFFNLTLTVIGDDAKMLRIAAVKPSCKKTIEMDPQYEDLQDFDPSWKRYKFAEFVLLYIYRFMDVPSKILSYVFLWYFIHGAVCIVFILVDVSVCVWMYCKTKYTDALLSVVAVPFTLGNKEYKKLLMMYLGGAMIETMVLNVVIWPFAALDVERGFIAFLWVYCSVCMMAKWIILYGFARLYTDVYYARSIGYFYDFRNVLSKCIDVFASERSKERSEIDTLVANKQWLDAMEVIFYKYSLSVASTKLYGKSDHMHQLKTVGDIAAKCNNKAIVQSVKREFDDRKVLDQGCFETELIRQSKKGNKENMESILNSTDTHWDYLWRKGDHFKMALSYAEDKDLESLIWDKALEILGNNDADNPLKSKIYLHLPYHASLLAVSLRHKQTQCFQLILEHSGLDIVDGRDDYETALKVAVDDGDIESIKQILNAPDINAAYIAMPSHGSSALSKAINHTGDKYVEIIKMIFECMNRVCDESERVDILNNVNDQYKWSALHVACREGLDRFKLVYDYYPTAFRKESLLRQDNGDWWDDKKGRIVLDICNEREYFDIKKFIEAEMAKLNSGS